MRRIMLMPVIAIALAACEAPIEPVGGLSARSPVLDKLPEGTEVLVAIETFPLPAGTELVVQGTGNTNSAYCVTPISGVPRLYLNSITLVGAGSDPDELRRTSFVFSTPMPPGTKFRISGPLLTYCGGGYPIYPAVVVNGS